jgi:tetratricopeptide (TPR) repeat protein
MKTTQLFSIGLLTLLCLTFSIQVMGQDPLDVLEAGDVAYSEGKYDEALAHYMSVDSTLGSFVYFYNLGNIQYKLGNYPKAILNYERAKKIDPLDEDLQHNLAMAQQKIPDRIEELPSLMVEDFWTNLLATGNLSKWAWLCLICLFIGLGLLTIQLFLQKAGLRRTLISIGIATVLASMVFLLVAKATFKRVQSNTSAILMQENVDVKAAPSDSGVLILMLHEGTKVWILQEQKEWYEVRIANGNVGWIKKSSCEII